MDKLLVQLYEMNLNKDHVCKKIHARINSSPTANFDPHKNESIPATCSYTLSPEEFFDWIPKNIDINVWTIQQAPVDFIQLSVHMKNPNIQNFWCPAFTRGRMISDYKTGFSSAMLLRKRKLMNVSGFLFKFFMIAGSENTGAEKNFFKCNAYIVLILDN